MTNPPVPPSNTDDPAPASKDELHSLHQRDFAPSVQDLADMLSHSKRVFMIGAGVSKVAGLPLMSELTQEVRGKLASHVLAEEILNEIMAHFNEALDCNLEDYMSELVDLISIEERRVARSARSPGPLLGGKNYTVSDLRGTLRDIKLAIKETIAKAPKSIDYHRRFIRAIHGRLQLGRSSDYYPVDYLTLNYDTLLEDALALERVTTADGFSGGATGWWYPEAYDDRRLSARVFKVHGSIDWCTIEDDPMPRRVRSSLYDDASGDPIVIWPAATKYREAQKDPYAQIIDRMRRSLRPSSNSEVVLTILGYSFGDQHVNSELDRALRDSGGHLTILVFTSTDKPEGLLASWANDAATRDHVRIHAKRGFFHGERQIDSTCDLPWWRFEILVRLLEGEQ